MNASDQMKGQMTARAFFDEFLRVSVGGRLVRMTLHAEQTRALDAWDAIDPATGLPRYSELALLWLKKAGKTTTVAGLGLHELVAGTEPDREIIFASSGLQQSKDVTFNAAVKFVRRHPWLTKHVRILSTELVYRQSIFDARTGGRHRQEHILRAVPTRNPEILHGGDHTLVDFDEFWSQSTYEAVEALASSPARRASRVLYSTYCGLRSQMREGNPLWDLWQRWKAGTDAGLYVSYIGGPDGWRQIPWITAKFIESQRRRFVAVPSKFKRLWQNEWAAGDEGNFLSGEEIHDAIDFTLVEPLGPLPDCHAGLDLALNRDWAAFAASHVDTSGKLTLAALRFWRGSKQKPISLMTIEDEIVRLAECFGLRRLTLDAWQAALMAERLRLRLPRVQIEAVAITPAMLDRFATSMKGLFSSRLIRIPNHPELIEQLECLVGTEQRRRDLVRFDSGRGQGAGGHDDLAVALMLSAEHHERAVGRAVLPSSFRTCYRAESIANFSPGSCFLLGGYYMPSGDRSCTVCPGYLYVRQAYQDHVGRGGERMDLRSFRRLHVLGNSYVARWRANDWADHML